MKKQFYLLLPVKYTPPADLFLVSQENEEGLVTVSAKSPKKKMLGIRCRPENAADAKMLIWLEWGNL